METEIILSRREIARAIQAYLGAKGFSGDRINFTSNKYEIKAVVKGVRQVQFNDEDIIDFLRKS